MTGDLGRAELETLGHLLSACGRPVELDFLIHEYSTTAKQVNHCIDQLICHGCRIERDMRSAWLLGSGLGVWSDYLKHALADSPPRDIEVYQKTASTQDLAKARADNPLLVLADEQTGGRGRLGRRWLAPPGTGLLFSMTHTPASDAPNTIDRVAFLAAVAVAQAIEHVTGHSLIQIKWPNDLTVGRRKLAGILVETVSQGPKSPPSLVIGVGINVGLTREHIHTMPPELQPSVTSFACEGWPTDRLYLAEHVIARIDRNLRERDIPALVDEWRVRNLFRDQSIRLANAGRTITGTVMDLDPDDGLIVRRDSGEIVHLPAATTTVML